MNKKIETILIWGFLIFSFFAAVYFVVDGVTKYNEIEDLKGKYEVVCPNGTIQNFTQEAPKYLCNDINHLNPFFNETNVGGKVIWQPEIK